jgi:hypothetical protein
MCIAWGGVCATHAPLREREAREPILTARGSGCMGTTPAGSTSATNCPLCLCGGIIVLSALGIFLGRNDPDQTYPPRCPTRTLIGQLCSHLRPPPLGTPNAADVVQPFGCPSAFWARIQSRMCSHFTPPSENPNVDACASCRPKPPSAFCGGCHEHDCAEHVDLHTCADTPGC